jgi:5-histidylcysteine sulfoxide synthase
MPIRVRALQVAKFSTITESGYSAEGLGRRDATAKVLRRTIRTANDAPLGLTDFGSKVPKQFATSAACLQTADFEVSVSSEVSTRASFQETPFAVSDEWLHGERPETWWTGAKPVYGECAGVQADGTLTSLALPNLATCSRQEVLDYFDNTWAITEVLLSALQGADTFIRAPGHNLRHPKIFYYGHPAVFYINKLRCVGVLQEPINSYYECIFETGVDEMGWDDLSQDASSWPKVVDVMEYRRQVYKTVREVIETHSSLDDGHAPIDQDSPMWALFMSFEHERIHLETSSVLIRELPLETVRGPKEWTKYHPSVDAPSTFTPVAGVDYPKNEFLPVAAQSVTAGKPKDYPTFGWDNEYGHREYEVAAFSASKFMITNGEYYEFVLDNGYQKQQYWTEAGWGWRTFRNAKKPTFWAGIGPQGLHQYTLRLLFDEVPMRWDWPVDANCHEATAFCNWKAEKDGLPMGENSYRLLTEAEYNCLLDEKKAIMGDANGTASDEILLDPVVSTFNDEKVNDATIMNTGKANVNMTYSSSSPVDENPPTATGHHDVMGNSWQWCEDQFCALPGFAIHPTYEDFSTPCFDGEHNMILGGSWMSTGANGASIFSRFSFRPHFFQHAGFRMVQPAAKEPFVLTSCHDCPPPYTGLLAQRNAHVFAQQSQKATKKAELQRQLAAHYAAPHDSVLSYLKFNGSAVTPEADFAVPFPQRCVALLDAVTAEHAEKTTGGETRRAFDLGCGVGGATFELARSHDEVVGLDISGDTLEVCAELQQKGRYSSAETMDIGVASDIDRSRVSWKHADAMGIPPSMCNYDTVLCANLLEHTPSPAGVLGRMGGPLGLVKPGGIALIVSPYSWSEETTPRSAWVGELEAGTADAVGEPMMTPVEELQEKLGDEFELVRDTEMPVLTRDSNRAFGLQVAHATAWKRHASATD